jgi:ferredoxin-thioredoxin reductase catalytic chain
MSDKQTVDQPTDKDRDQASPKNVEKMWKFVEKFAEKSGSYLHPQRDVTEFLVIGLAKHIDEVGRPLCPCNFYEDKVEEAKSSEWICACEEMQKYKYCH